MKKRHWKILLLLLLSFFVLSACIPKKEEVSNTDNNSNTDNDTNTDNGTNSKEGTKISVFMPESDDMDLETNSFTLFAEEKFGIDFEFETTSYDGAAAKERRQITLASGDYPDVYFLIEWVDQFTASDLLKYGKQGVLIPLNDLIKEHAPNLQAVLDENEEFRKMATAPDGNIYGVPQLEECFHCTWPNKFWINTDWLEKLNLEMPKTHEEFKQVLKAFKEQDPNGNGEDDEIPLSGSVANKFNSIVPNLMNGFIYDDIETRLSINNGKVNFVANTTEWKEGLKYIHSLYKEGLVDPGAFTQNSDAYGQLGNNPEVVLGVGAATHPWEFVDNDNHVKYDALAPLKGPNSQYSSYYYPVVQGANFAITNKASEEAQIKAIKLLDYMFTQEGQTRSHFGVEGEDWVKPEEGDVAVNEEVEPILKQLHPEEPTNNSWGAAAQFYQPREYRDGWVQSTDIYTDQGYERRLQEATYLYEGLEPNNTFPFWAIWYDEATQSEIATLKTNILDVEQSAVRFITGDLDLEKDWQDYVEGLNSLQVDRYVEINQEAYNKYLNAE